jgi:hypothetical protein
MTNIEQKLKDIADVCFSSMPPLLEQHFEIKND